MATSKRQVLLQRVGQIERWSAWAGLITHDADPKTGVRKSMSLIRLYGTLNEPVKGNTLFQLTFAEGTPYVGSNRPKSIGAVLGTRPRIEGHVTLHSSEFQMMLTLAASGNLRYLCWSFQEPRYGSGLITSLDFGSEDPDQKQSD